MQLEQERCHKHIAIVNLTRNFGLEGAVAAGLKYAKGDAVVVMDADLQDPPCVILDMIAKWEGGAETVTGIRSSRRSDSLFKRKSADVFYKLLDDLSGKVKIRRGAANYRLLSRRVVDVLNSLPESNAIFRVVVPYVGLKTDYVEYERDRRFAGESKYNLKSMIPYALDNITNISIEPLRKTRISVYFSVILLVASIIGFAALDGALRAAAIVCVFISFIAVVLFICISVVAEYIAQILIEVKGRPISIVESYTPTQKDMKSELR